MLVLYYDSPSWPGNPLFYANFPSISDSSMAPKGKEACFILVPIAPGIEDTKKIRDHYLELVINRLEKLTHQPIKKEEIFCESFVLMTLLVNIIPTKATHMG